MTAEIPIWVNGNVLHVSGVNRKTTCEEIIQVVLSGTEMSDGDIKDFGIVERWRRVERPLDNKAKILKVWSHWGDERSDVRFTLKKVDNEADSGRGSPAGAGYVSSMRRRKSRNRLNGKPPWNRQETLHPKRLAELGEYNWYEEEDYVARIECKENKPHEDHYARLKTKQAESRRCLEIMSNEKIYSSKQEVNQSGARRKYECPATGVLHSTLLPEKSQDHPAKGSKCCKKKRQKIRNSENIEKLMKLILAQGATIQTQLQRLKEREEQIEHIEHERHRERLEKNGRNYLLETYLGSLNEAELPRVSDDEEKGNDSGVHTEGGSDQMNPTWVKEKKRLDAEKRFKCNEETGKISETESEVRQSRREQMEEQKKVISDGLTKSERTPRSKSEGRTKSDKERLYENRTLKRTKSENVLCDGRVCEKGEEEVIGTKEEVEESVELSNLRSQIELWEKVLRINKKLEKEEETLVRLHIKIRKYQAENLKQTKERYEENTATNSKDINHEEDGEEYHDIQNGLEKLRKDLDQNSKEIYQNFTKLISSDEEMTKKRSYMKQVISDLERIEEECQMLTEMVDSSKPDNLPETSVDPPDEDLHIEINEDTKEREATLTEVVVIEDKVAEEPVMDSIEVIEDQRNPTPDIIKPTMYLTETEEKSIEVKAKTMKISFDEHIKNSEDTELQILEKPIPSSSSAKKGILKNRNYTPDPIDNTISHGLEKNTVDHSPNIQNDTMTEKIWKSRMLTENISQIYEIPFTYNPYGVQNSVPEANFRQPHPFEYHNPIYGSQGDPYKVYEHANGGIYTTRRIFISQKGVNNNCYPPTIVTTKAQVHNDTDSNSSSETSGLSSMHSNSPTTGDRYIEGVYILDTLV